MSAPELHRLKIDPEPMDDLLSGAKTGEVRNDDRGFRVGDCVHLTCADGRETDRIITHIQRGYGLPDGLCVLSYRSDLCASGQQVRAEWLPIKTAPKDGSWFLGTSTAWNNDVVIVGWHFGAWREAAEPEGADYTLTHWMPLPSAPPAALTPAPQPEVAPMDNPALVEALREVSQALAWQCFGECRGFSENLKSPSEALSLARTALASHEAPQPSAATPTAQEAVPSCVACEDNPKHPNIPCAVCNAHPPQLSETVADAAAVILSAIERAQIDMTILRKFMNGEPCAALRALKGEEG